MRKSPYSFLSLKLEAPEKTYTTDLQTYDILAKKQKRSL